LAWSVPCGISTAKLYLDDCGVRTGEMSEAGTEDTIERYDGSGACPGKFAAERPTGTRAVALGDLLGCGGDLERGFGVASDT